jgi:hypothetical protein
MAFVQIDNVVINSQHVLMVVREPQETLVYLQDKSFVPRTYRGTLGAAVWAYFSARAAQLQRYEEQEIQNVEMPNGKTLWQEEELEI